MNTGRVLLGTGDPEKCKGLRAVLEFEGHQVFDAVAASEILGSISSKQYDVLILDDGLEPAGVFALCRDIRSMSNIAIIILSRDDSAQVRIDALNAGADDFLPPGFALAELMARVRAILRRVTPVAANRHHVMLADREINFQSHEITGPDGRVAHLTPKECLVLRHLVSHANKPLTPQSLAQNIWQRDGMGQIEFVRVVVKQLRRKLEPDPGNPRYILTQRAAGYQFHMPV
jgi:two-component system, OmpR family, KDP operon response regulator KdpE